MPATAPSAPADSREGVWLVICPANPKWTLIGMPSSSAAAQKGSSASESCLFALGQPVSAAPRNPRVGIVCDAKRSRRAPEKED